MCKSQISLRAIIYIVQHEGEIIYRLELSAFTLQQEVPHNPIPAAVASLLDSFQTVFTMLQELPPPRSREHNIILKEGTGPISIRPYRYAQAQKDDIERLVKEMLQAGIVQPSTNPFSSPVLLVKKMDGN